MNAFFREEFELSTVWHELIVSATIGAAFLSALVAGQAAGEALDHQPERA